MRETDLLPCPFCGCPNPRLWSTKSAYGKRWHIKCVDGCSVSIDGYDSADMAEAAWNSRPPVGDDMTVTDMFAKFAPGTMIKVRVIFPGEYRVSWETTKHVQVTGFPHYYSLAEAVDRALQAYLKIYGDEDAAAGLVSPAEYKEFTEWANDNKAEKV